MATFDGTIGNDTLTGGVESDVMNGAEGNDSLRGGAGNDSLNGGAGNDTLLGEDGHDVIAGGLGNDFLNGGAGNDRLYGEDGNDGFYGGGGEDWIEGGAGADNIFGDGGHDFLSGGADADKLNGGAGNDTIDGGAGADTIDGGAGNDTFIIRAGEGGDVITGGAGVDRVVLDIASADVSGALRAEFAAYQDWMAGLLADAGGDINALAANSTGATFTFASLGLTIGTFEGMSVAIDGAATEITDIINAVPAVEATVNVATAEDTPFDGTVEVTGDSFGELSWAVLTAPAEGALVLDEATGRYVYTPDADCCGSDCFVVRVTGANGLSADQTVHVAVASVNDAPVTAAGIAIATDEDASVSGILAATDADGDALTWSVAEGPAHGNLVLDGATGAYTYTGAANYNGSDTFTVRVSDGAGGSAVQTVSVGIAAVNDAPVADAASSVTASEDESVSGAVAASDVDGDALTWSVAEGPVHGELVLDASTGQYTYTGGKDYNGADAFVVRIADGSGASVLQTVSVGIAAVNDGPVTEAASSLGLLEDGTASGAVAASDIDGDALSWTVAEGPAHGKLVLDGATGMYTYAGDKDYNGTDTFAVRVTDSSGASVLQTVSVAIGAVNDGPVAAANASLSLAEDGSASGTVVATDIEGDKLSWQIAAGPAHGAVNLDRATGQYVYTADANYSGADSFMVSVADGHGGVAEQRVAVAVAAVADAPVLSVRDARASASQTLAGSAGNDTLTGSFGNDVISGGDGNDLLRGDTGTGNVTMALDIAAALTDVDGSETLSVLISGLPFTATLSAGTKNANGTWTLSAAQLAGLTMTAANTAAFNLTVTAKATEIAGGSASSAATLNVSVDRGTGSDTIDGGAGNDTIYGGAGSSRLTDGTGNDKVYGQSGDDTFVSGAGNDTLDGGAGFDVLDMSAATSGVVANLLTGVATGLGTDSVLNFEGIIGSAFNDTLTGNSTNSRITAGAGNDKLYGNGGNDTLDGGAGSDTLDGGSGNDTFYDGTGADTVTGGAGNDYMRAGSGPDKFSGGTGTDTLDYGDAASAITIDVQRKTVTGWSTDTVDTIEKFVGSSFNDTFKGGRQANTFEGGAGNDTFRGMGGTDVFTGGAGNDTFMWMSSDVTSGKIYAGGDHITDFAAGDTLNVHDLMLANAGKAVADVIHVTDGAAGTVLSVSVKGGFKDFVTLENVHGVTVASLLSQGMLVL